MRIDRQRLVAWVILGGVGFGLSYTRLALLGIVLCIAGWMWVLRLLLQKRLYGGYLAHFFLGFLAFCTVGTLIAVGLSLAGVATALATVVGVNLLLIAGAGYRLYKQPVTGAQPAVVRPHWLLIVASLAIISLFTVPIFARPTTANLLRSSMYGYDDAAHVGMVRADTIAQGITTNVDLHANPGINLDPNTPSYPQGLHVSISVLGRGVFRLLHTSVTNARVLLLSYRLGTALFYGAIVVLLVEVMAQLAGKLRGPDRALEFSSQLYLSVIALLAYATLVFPEILFAGEPFLATLAMLLAALLLSLLALDNLPAKRVALAAACLFAIGTMYTWILSAIVAFGMLALVAASEADSQAVLSRLKQLPGSWRQFSYRELWQNTWAWRYLVVAGLLCIPQVWLLLFKSKIGAAAALNINGGILAPDQSRYMLLMFGVFVLILLLASQKSRLAELRRSRTFTAVLLFLCPLLLLLFFYAVQTLTTGQLSYYYVKATYVADLAVLALVGVALVHGLYRTRAAFGTVQSLAVGLVVCGVLAVYLALGKGFLGYAHGTNPSIDPRLTAKAGQLIDSGVRPKNIISYTGRSYEEDMYFNLLTGQLDQPSLPQRHLIEILAVQKRYPVMEHYIGLYAGRSEKTYILASKATAPSIKAALPADANYQLIIVE